MSPARSLLVHSFILLALAGCNGTVPELPAEEPPKRSPVERGEYLVKISGCNDCHTPKKMGDRGPEPDTTRLLSGHPEEFQELIQPDLTEPWEASTTLTLTAWAGPWGISYATNLTPDEETGLGSWDEATFIEAMRTGLHLGQGRPILPPMPLALAEATDEDLEAIFAYLRSIPAVRNSVPDPLIIEH